MPEPDDGYTDLSGDRWSGLKEYFEPPASAAKPRRERRWWRVVAPVAALAVLALVVGIVAVNRGGGSSRAAVVRGGADRRPAPPTRRSDYGEDHGASATAEHGRASSFADQLDRFAVVVLARARQATGALQRFAVLRIFKGDAPKVVELEVDGQPADAGPSAPAHARPGRRRAPQETVLARAHPVARPTDPRATPAALGPASRSTVAYTYQGEPTVVREFAAGTDPDTVSLPIP